MLNGFRPSEGGRMHAEKVLHEFSSSWYFPAEPLMSKQYSGLTFDTIMLDVFLQISQISDGWCELEAGQTEVNANMLLRIDQTDLYAV